MATLRTADGVDIDARHDAAESELGIVVAHGFTGSWRRPAVRRIADLLTGYGGVVSFDFRGHGRSTGRSTVGDREVLDVEAAVAWARELGYRRVATIGFSMGASVTVRHAALYGNANGNASSSDSASRSDSASSSGNANGNGLAAVVAVSGPSRWYYRGTPSMRRAHWVIERPVGRLVGRVVLKTRISSAGWDPVPEAPFEVVGKIAPVPLLVVHGDADHYFPVEHAEKLYAEANEPKQLWIESGFGHAENAAPDELVQRIGAWLAGVAPAR